MVYILHRTEARSPVSSAPSIHTRLDFDLYCTKQCREVWYGVFLAFEGFQIWNEMLWGWWISCLWTGLQWARKNIVRVYIRVLTAEGDYKLQPTNAVNAVKILNSRQRTNAADTVNAVNAVKCCGPNNHIPFTTSLLSTFTTLKIIINTIDSCLSTTYLASLIWL
jgi:hypothetical protein